MWLYILVPLKIAYILKQDTFSVASLFMVIFRFYNKCWGKQKFNAYFNIIFFARLIVK
jgi:hypothetical protein